MPPIELAHLPVNYPLNCAGHRIRRRILSPSQTTAIVEKLSEPDATLVLFLAVTGLRIGEAIAIKWSDFEGDVLYVQRRIYDRKVDTTKSRDSNRRIPIPPELLERLKALGEQGEWIFHGRGGVALNPGNALKRYIRPVAAELKIELGGWHDFRHTVATSMLRAGHGVKVVSQLLGHFEAQNHEGQQHVPPKRLQSVPAFHMPEYTIFKAGPEGLYSFPPVALLFLFIGNFLGEELYFRGYLMKKIGFFGNSAWIVNSFLFALYHLWQIPQTWPLIGLVFAFGLLMQLRKDLYTLIAFHLFVNMWLTYGAYPLARLVHLAK